MRLGPGTAAPLRWVALLALAGVVSGCGYQGPPPADAGIPVPERWAESGPAAPSPGLDLRTYWEQLDDPLLASFVEGALAANLDIAQGVARLNQSRAQLALARAGYFPQLSTSGSVGRNFGGGSSDNLQFSLGGDASWETDLFGRISANVAVSRADLDAAGYSVADLQRLIAGQVARATISARSSAAQLTVARDTLRIQDDNLQIAQWRVQAGLVSSLDVEQARSQRAQTAATIPLLEGNLVATANSISTLMGEVPGQALAALQDDTFVPAPPDEVGFAAPAEVLRRRPDVRSAEFTLIASSAQIDVARAQLLPLVQLGGSITSAADGISNLFDLVTGGLFASVSQVLFDGGRLRSRVDLAEATAQGALAAWRQTILVALEEVETAAVDFRNAQERVATFSEGLDAANNSAILARSQYEAGLTDFPTLLVSENQLLSARNSLVSAEAERANAFVSLTQALGGGWSPADFPPPATDRSDP